MLCAHHSHTAHTHALCSVRPQRILCTRVPHSTQRTQRTATPALAETGAGRDSVVGRTRRTCCVRVARRRCIDTAQTGPGCNSDAARVPFAPARSIGSVPTLVPTFPAAAHTGLRRGCRGYCRIRPRQLQCHYRRTWHCVLCHSRHVSNTHARLEAQ